MLRRSGLHRRQRPERDGLLQLRRRLWRRRRRLVMRAIVDVHARAFGCVRASDVDMTLRVTAQTKELQRYHQQQRHFHARFPSPERTHRTAPVGDWEGRIEHTDIDRLALCNPHCRSAHDDVKRGQSQSSFRRAAIAPIQAGVAHHALWWGPVSALESGTCRHRLGNRCPAADLRLHPTQKFLA